MNLRQMMKQAQEMQEKLRQEIAGIEVESSVGGGMVTIRMAGDKSLRAITIERDVLDPDDPEMLQDLILSAFTEATRKVDEEIQARLGAVTGLGSIPGLGI